MQCLPNGNFQSNATNLDAVIVYIQTDDTILCVREAPTPLVFFIYGFLVPSLATFGLCANFINAIVFMRPKMTPSAFSYLAALSILDCLSCLLICLTALSRSVLYEYHVWLVYDFQCQMALFGITTGSANLILACVSCDRLIYLRQGMPSGTPRFCRRKVARCMITVVIIVSSFLNLPYFFVFVVNDDNTFQPTLFYYSSYYKIHNWFTFIIMAVCPAIFLLIGNAAIIVAFRKWTKQSKRMQICCHKGSKTTQKRFLHQMKLTITILIVISLYLVGELPAHLTSWKSALNLLYGGDISKVDFQLMDELEMICITLNALQLSMNIIVYAVINPSFMPEFFKCLKGASDVCFRFFCITAISRCCLNFWQRNSKEASPGENENNGQSVENIFESNDGLSENCMNHLNEESSCVEIRAADENSLADCNRGPQNTVITTISASIDCPSWPNFNSLDNEDEIRCLEACENKLDYRITKCYTYDNKTFCKSITVHQADVDL